ncbi:tetraspanin-18-like [Clupea harengus]|uniref:Tetraspanin-18-like n=1 Tax=Clupea harengus TaxID=7950 RepID=A0A8M1K8G0_CLUHA|nr:tetraspanin-18-like [Clupea harengus]
MCCSEILKIINGAIFLVGAALLGLGVSVMRDSKELCYLLIGLSAALILMGFLGNCGPVKKSRCMLLTYFIIVLIIFIAEVAGGIAIISQPSTTKVPVSPFQKIVAMIRDNAGVAGATAGAVFAVEVAAMVGVMILYQKAD